MVAPALFTAVGIGAALVTYVIYHQITYTIAARKFARTHGCKPPTKDRLWDPILGLDFVISTIRASRGKYQLLDLQKRLARLGSTFTLNILGESLIFTDEPKNVQAVLATQFPDYDVGELRRQATVKLLGHGIFNADGPYWEHSRALIRPNFVRKQVGDLRLMEHHVMHMISYLPADGTPVDIQSFFFRMTLDTATEFLFGKSINSLDPDATAESRKFSWAFDYALSVIAQKLRLAKFNRAYNGRRYKEACNYLHDYVRPIIHHAVEYRKAKNIVNSEASLVKDAALANKARKANRTADAEKTALLGSSPLVKELSHVDPDDHENESDERYVFLYELAKHTGNENELRDQVINTLIAGRDTTASLMSSTLFVLSRRPEIWAKLQAEVAFLNGKAPTFDQIKDLRYLRNILHESLRMFPVVPINAKFANKDTTLPRGGGPDGLSPMFVQKGQMIIWVLYSMHRRTDLWGKDAEEFRPERWEGLLPGFNFLPFNGGPRICPGQQFALTEASYTLIRLAQQFSRIEVVPGQEDRPWVEALNLTCAVSGGVNVKCWK